MLGRIVALKRIRTAETCAGHEAGHDPGEQARRILREARVAARLDHPRLLRVHDIVQADGVPWLVLQHVEARTWASLCQEHAPLEPRAAAHVAAQVADALVALHGEGIVHGDVTPENVLVDRDGDVKLVDFGMSRLIGEEVGAGVMTGVRDYRAPEVVAGEPPGPAADVYALGATVHEAVGGSPVVAGTPPPPASAGALTGVLERLLQRDPGDRPDAASTREMLVRVAVGDSS